MDVSLEYGKTGITVSIPDGVPVTVIEPSFVHAAADPRAAVREALRAPIGSPALRRSVRPTDTVGVVFSDVTRPTPNELILPPILDELQAAGVPREHITLFNSTGTHRLNTPEELARLLGRQIAESYRIIQNDARAEGEHVSAGTTASGNEIFIQKDFLACSYKILTGFIEPHFFAGFSGGGKAVMPGMARLDTVIRNHSARHIDDPGSQWAVLDGNPLRAEIEQAVSLVRPDFLVNVTLNRDKEITRCFAGAVGAAYGEGTRFVKEHAMRRVDHPFDIVLTSNSGYPLDLNLYQAVKGMSAAARVTRPGGAIIVASECRDGIPDHGSFGTLLRETTDARDLLARVRAPGFMLDDQWQAHILALIVSRADVFVHAEGLTPEQIVQAKLKPCRSIDAQLRSLLARYGPHAEVCVLPEGPQTIPYVEKAT